MDNGIELLLITDLYPTPTDPMRGSFVREHACASMPYVGSLTVANIALSGKNPEMRKDEVEARIKVLQGGAIERRIPKLLRPPLYSLWFRKALRRIISETDPDIVHAHGGILSGSLARRISEKKGLPFFITEHFGTWEKWARDPLKKRILSRNYRKAEGVIGVSHYLRERIQEKFTDINPITIPNPVDTELFESGTNEREKCILFVSRLDPNKGGMRTLRAFEALHEKHPEWKLKIHGSGQEKERISEALEKTPSLQQRVELGPQLSRKELASTMQKASFLVLPSEYESFGLVIAESLSCGTPVIAPDNTGPSDIFFEGAGRAIDPLDRNALQKAMEEMIALHGSFDARKLHERIDEKFGKERVGAELSKLYQKALGQG